MRTAGRRGSRGAAGRRGSRAEHRAGDLPMASDTHPSPPCQSKTPRLHPPPARRLRSGEPKQHGGPSVDGTGRIRRRRAGWSQAVCAAARRAPSARRGSRLRRCSAAAAARWRASSSASCAARCATAAAAEPSPSRSLPGPMRSCREGAPGRERVRRGGRAPCSRWSRAHVVAGISTGTALPPAPGPGRAGAARWSGPAARWMRNQAAHHTRPRAGAPRPLGFNFIL